MSKEEPPDKYQCLKVPVSSIIRKEDKITLEVLQNAIIRTNNITTNTYFLLRLWVLEKYHNDLEIPEITDDTIKMCMCALKKASKGNQPQGNNALLKTEFQQLKSLYLGNIPFEDGVNLSSVLQYYSTTMLTAIENNIKMRFFDYVKRFINSYFKYLYQEEIKDKEFKKNFYKELNLVKNDILNNTLTSNEKYHVWINENKFKIVPETFENSYYYDIKCHPQKYFKNMIFMNLELEKINGKMFQFFPLQTNSIPKHIQLDTKALIELFITEKDTDFFKLCYGIDTKTKEKVDIKTKADLYKFVELNKEMVWYKIFHIKSSLRKYDFDYTIITDGYATSLRFLHKDYVEIEQLKKNKKKIGRDANKGLTKEEKDIKRETKKQSMKSNKPIPVKKQTKKEPSLPEFPYIDEVSKEELFGKHIFIDPGKRSLLSMMDDEGNFLSYTNSQRMKETKRLKYQRVLKKYKDELGITTQENELTKHNSKTCNIENFVEFVLEKTRINELVAPLYNKEKFRQYKWFAYISKKRTEDNMLNKIEKKYSKDHIIIIGDWSIGKQMRNFISTPNLSIKRKLQTRFQVYNIDEFRTSCLNYITEAHCNNLYLPDKKGKDRKIHAILTYQMENNRMGCINRDKNGCKNIQKVFDSYIETGERPEMYSRETKLNKSSQPPSSGKVVK